MKLYFFFQRFDFCIDGESNDEDEILQLLGKSYLSQSIKKIDIQLQFQHNDISPPPGGPGIQKNTNLIDLT